MTVRSEGRGNLSEVDMDDLRDQPRGSGKSFGGQREFSAGNFFDPPGWVREHASERYWWQAVRDVYKNGNLWKVREGTTSDLETRSGRQRGVMSPNYGAVITRWKELVLKNEFGLDQVPERDGEEYFPGIDSFNDKIREMKSRAARVMRAAREGGAEQAKKVAAKVMGHSSAKNAQKNLGRWANFNIIDAIKGNAPMGGDDLAASRNVDSRRAVHETRNDTMGKRNESIADRIDRKLEERRGGRGGGRQGRRNDRRLSEASERDMYAVVTRDGAMLYADDDRQMAYDFAKREEGDVIGLEDVPSDLAEKLIDFSQGNTMGAFRDQYEAWQAALPYANLPESRQRGGRRMSEGNNDIQVGDIVKIKSLPGETGVGKVKKIEDGEAKVYLRPMDQDWVPLGDLEFVRKGSDNDTSNPNEFMIGDPVFHIDAQEPGRDGKVVDTKKGKAMVMFPRDRRPSWYSTDRLTLAASKDIDVDALVRENEELRKCLDETTRAYVINQKLVELPLAHRDQFLECIEGDRTFRTLEEFRSYVDTVYDAYCEEVDPGEPSRVDESRVASDPDDPQAEYFNEVKEGLVEENSVVSDRVLQLAGLTS